MLVYGARPYAQVDVVVMLLLPNANAVCELRAVHTRNGSVWHMH